MKVILIILFSLIITVSCKESDVITGKFSEFEETFQLIDFINTLHAVL